MRTYESIGLGIPEILLPKAGVDLTKWAVIACDQYTSEPEYWQKAADLVGDAPSTLNIIYPEVYLGEKNPEARIANIRESMNRYLTQALSAAMEGFIYVERTVGGRARKGLMACLDLEHYDFRKGSTSLIRATEGTIMDRIPPRVKIREGAPIESPHIMVLIDDPAQTVIGPLAANKARLRKLYDFDLMLGSGRLAGYRVENPDLEAGVLSGLKALADPKSFIEKYGLKPGAPVLLFAMGDGNHSLATAKTIWEKVKESAFYKSAIMKSPLRYALVELVNLHDEALVFEPIHRVLFGLAAGPSLVDKMNEFYPGKCRRSAAASLDEMKAAVDHPKESAHKIGTISDAGFGILEIARPASNLPLGTLQNFLDAFMKAGGAREIDYVHGTESVIQIGKKPGNIGLYLPAMKKDELFRTVILDGALPRKTFSMGEAYEKRFYMEARKLF
ncbi:MAG: DUF1015 domain-containing protein [Candidatus Aminicenantales bacterium]